MLAIALAASPNLTPPPGTLNPQVTQANISRTICVPGWTKTVRPPVAYTGSLKRKQMTERHLPGKPGDYEEDHYVPLELGGNPTDPKNLWPQPIQEAHVKDRLETALNRAVCGGKMTLRDAQQCIMTGWAACARRMHIAGAP
jgi:hypothetical protein